mgnify:CR=1 FL=1
MQIKIDDEIIKNVKQLAMQQGDDSDREIEFLCEYLIRVGLAQIRGISLWHESNGKLQSNKRIKFKEKST